MYMISHNTLRYIVQSSTVQHLWLARADRNKIMFLIHIITIQLSHQNYGTKLGFEAIYPQFSIKQLQYLAIEGSTSLGLSGKHTSGSLTNTIGRGQESPIEIIVLEIINCKLQMIKVPTWISSNHQGVLETLTIV